MPNLLMLARTWACLSLRPVRWLSAACLLLVISCGGGSDSPQPAMMRAEPDLRPTTWPAAASASSLKHLRAVHAMGRWGGNVRGFVSPLLNEAPTVSVQRATVTTNRGSFVDSQGVTQTNDLAQVTLEGVTLGSGTALARAGFWVYRDVRTGSSGIQFRPQLDSNLAGINGFAGDVNISVPAVGSTVAPDLTAVRALSGSARALVLAVLAQGGNLARSATYTVSGGATFGDMASLSAALDRVTALLDTDKAYFDYLASMNVEWIGVSVAMHNDNVGTGEIVTRTCGDASGFTDSNGVDTPCTFADADLQSFITRARARGFRIYLTLAFETSGTPPDNSPTCGTTAYKVARYWLGIPELPAGSPAARCVSTANWWWNPAHPQHATKVAQFWASYQQIATRYAAMAQSLGVEIFSLGTETETLFRTRAGTGVFTNHFLPQLQAMVQSVRQVYSGWLTYDQHSNQLLNPEWFGGAQAVHYVFADLGLDLVGISAYFELVSTPPNRVLTVGELETAWERIFASALGPLRDRNPGKPVLFLEFGVVDHVNSPYDQQYNAGQTEPSFDANHPTDGMLQQSNVYQAFFNVNTRYGDLVRGAFFWGHDYLPYNTYTCSVIDWGTSCRPARQVLTHEYARWKALDQGGGTVGAQHSGWWWNAAEPGRGYFVEVANGRFFSAAFLYDTSGAPLWYVTGPGAVGGNTLSGTLDRYSGGQTLTGAYRPATGPVPAGNVVFEFSSTAAGSMQWAGGSIPLTRYEISPGSLSAAAPAFRPETGWWWNAAEGGRGFALEVQGDAFFIAGFMYDSAGAPMWYVSGGRATAPNRLEGTWQSCANGQALGVAFRPTTCTNLASGNLQFVFSDARNGVLTLPDGRAVALTRFTF